MNDRDRLLESLETEPWHTLLALADWHEEQGQGSVAAGYRWLVQHTRRPLRRKVWVKVPDPPPDSDWKGRHVLQIRYCWRVQGTLTDVENTLPQGRLSPGGCYELRTFNAGTRWERVAPAQKPFTTVKGAYEAAAASYVPPGRKTRKGRPA